MTPLRTRVTTAPPGGTAGKRTAATVAPANGGGRRGGCPVCPRGDGAIPRAPPHVAHSGTAVDATPQPPPTRAGAGDGGEEAGHHPRLAVAACAAAGDQHRARRAGPRVASVGAWVPTRPRGGAAAGARRRGVAAAVGPRPGDGATRARQPLVDEEPTRRAVAGVPTRLVTGVDATVEGPPTRGGAGVEARRGSVLLVGGRPQSRRRDRVDERARPLFRPPPGGTARPPARVHPTRQAVATDAPALEPPPDVVGALGGVGARARHRRGRRPARAPHRDGAGARPTVPLMATRSGAGVGGEAAQRAAAGAPTADGGGGTVGRPRGRLRGRQRHPPTGAGGHDRRVTCTRATWARVARRVAGVAAAPEEAPAGGAAAQDGGHGLAGSNGHHSSHRRRHFSCRRSWHLLAHPRKVPACLAYRQGC